MKENEKQTDFSLLYRDLISDNDSLSNKATNNSFAFISFYLNDYPTNIDLKDFKQTFKYQRDLKADSDYAFDCFQLEFSLLEDDKSTYLNTNVDFLFNCYENALNKNVFITNAILQLFSKICLPPIATYLNSQNRKRFSKWFSVKEPIKSFVLKKLPEDKWFENRFMNKMMYGYGFEEQLISDKTTIRTFKALFEGKYLENKINWIDNKSSLCYFIKLLISEKVIRDPKNKHWEIVSEFFLLKGEPIKQSELINQKATTNKNKINNIKTFVGSLANYYS